MQVSVEPITFDPGSRGVGDGRWRWLVEKIIS
jgi:hypothetical protein